MPETPPPTQFYETVVLLEKAGRYRPLSYVTSPASAIAGRRDLSYGDLLDDAIASEEISPKMLPYAIESLVELPPDPDAAFSEWRLDFTLGQARPTLGLEATELPLVPVESSPLSKRSLMNILSSGGTATLGFFLGGPVLMIVAPIGLAAVRAAGGAVWEGVRPEVVEFSEDASAALFDALRAKLGIARRKK